MRIVVANWKMNFLSGEARDFCEAFLADHVPSPSVTVAVAPPFHLIRPVADSLRSRQVRVFGQNGHAEPKGAFTGEVSMAQLQDAGCSGVILGHSERRQLFGETDEALVAKVKAAHDWNLLPLLCVGETLEERTSGRTLSQTGSSTSSTRSTWSSACSRMCAMSAGESRGLTVCSTAPESGMA